MNIFNKIFKKKIAAEDDILNRGLKYSMEFGENFLQPIHNRLENKYSHLNKSQLEFYSKTCQQVRYDGNQFVYYTLERLNVQRQNISEKKLRDDFHDFIKNKYSWTTPQNINSLFSQSCYFAWKDGLDCVIK